MNPTNPKHDLQDEDQNQDKWHKMMLQPTVLLSMGGMAGDPALPPQIIPRWVDDEKLGES